MPHCKDLRERVNKPFTQVPLDAMGSTHPASAMAEARHGPYSMDSLHTDDIDWDLVVLTLWEYGFAIPGPHLDGISFWLMSDKYRTSQVAFKTLIQTLCGGYAFLALGRIDGGCVGLPGRLRRVRLVQIKRTKYSLASGSVETRTASSRGKIRFRMAHAPYGWPRATDRRFRLVAGHRVNPWRPPGDHWVHGCKEEVKRSG